MIRTLSSILSLGLFTLGAIVACSASEEKDPYASADDFCAAWSERACITAVVDNCSQEGGEKASCRSAQKGFCSALIADKTYRRKAVEACLDYVKEAYSDAQLTADEASVVLKLAAPCAQVIGKGGKLCSKNTDCEDGVCAETIPGVRVCHIGGGFACSAGGQLKCAPEFYCNGTNCVQRGDAGTACEVDDQCGSEQLCEITTVEADPEADPPVEASSTGECVARLGTNEECVDDEECQSGWCSDGTCKLRVILSDTSSICDDLS